MWPREGTVLTVSARALVQACERLGVDTERLLRTVGVDRPTLENPDARDRLVEQLLRGLVLLALLPCLADGSRLFLHLPQVDRVPPDLVERPVDRVLDALGRDGGATGRRGFRPLHRHPRLGPVTSIVWTIHRSVAPRIWA